VPAGGRGQVYEHRLVAWQAGILKQPWHVVKHRNGDKSDNRPETLVVLSEPDSSKHACKGTRLRVGYCSGCACTGRVRRVGDKRFCGKCYPEARREYLRQMAHRYQPKLITCAHCQRDGVRHYGNGLCEACGRRLARTGSLERTAVPTL